MEVREMGADAQGQLFSKTWGSWEPGKGPSWLGSSLSTSCQIRWGEGMTTETRSQEMVLSLSHDFISNWMTGELWSSSLIMTMKRMMEVMLVVVMVRVGTMLRVIHLLISIYGSSFYLSILSSQRWVEERHRGLGHLPKVPEGRAGVWTQEVKLSEPKCLSTTLHSFSKRWKGRD